MFGEAYQICRKLSLREPLLLVLVGMWGWRLVRAEMAECFSLADELSQLADDAGDLGARVEGHWAFTCTLFYLGQFSGSVQHAIQGIQLFDSQPDASRPFCRCQRANCRRDNSILRCTGSRPHGRNWTGTFYDARIRRPGKSGE